MFPLLATVTQDQAIDSIRSTLGARIDGQLLAWVGGFAALVIGVLIYFSQRMKRNDGGGLNHNGKLIKEISEAVGLKPAEMKKLRVLAEQLNEPGQPPMKNPLVLLLCPSLLAKAMKKKG